MARERVFVAIGSNLGDPVGHVHGAMAELDRLAGTRVVRASSAYRNPAVGPGEQAEYVNAVVELDTALAPEPLLDALQAIERRHGRVRGAERWAPRTLDLDLIAYGERRLDGERLVLPHPRAHERAFVLVPLAEIAPEAVVPGHGSARELAARVDASSMRALAPPRAGTAGRHG